MVQTNHAPTRGFELLRPASAQAGLPHFQELFAPAAAQLGAGELSEAGERTFQLLTQVAGRAGRKDKHGEVVIQTYEPKDSSIVLAQNHDYAGFYDFEVAQREALSYPPFSRLIAVISPATGSRLNRNQVDIL